MHVLILAAGGLGRTIADILSRSAEHTAAGFCDDHADPSTPIAGLPVVGSTDDLAAIARQCGADGAVAAVGDPTVRKALAAEVSQAGLALPAIIDPTAIVSASAVADEGVVIGAGAIIGPGVRIGRLAIIGAAAVIEHDAVCEPACYVGPRCLIDARAIVGAGAIVTGGRCIAPDAVEPGP